jgi:hypothetical protein
MRHDSPHSGQDLLKDWGFIRTGLIGPTLFSDWMVNAHSENGNHHSMVLKIVPAVSTTGIPDPKHPLMAKEIIPKAVIG